jgi:hypothetical protein
MQQFTETCQACGRNIWDTDACVGEKPKKKKKKKKLDWGDGW